MCLNNQNLIRSQPSNSRLELNYEKKMGVYSSRLHNLKLFPSKNCKLEYLLVKISTHLLVSHQSIFFFFLLKCFITFAADLFLMEMDPNICRSFQIINKSRRYKNGPDLLHLESSGFIYLFVVILILICK